MHFAGGVALFFKKRMPGSHCRCLAHRDSNLAHDGSIESLALHADRHLVDAGHVLTLNDALQVYITERCHLHAHCIIKVAFGAKHEDVGLNSHALQFLHRVLRGFGLQLVGSFQIGHIGQMHTHGIATQLPTQLSDGLHKWCALDVADGASHLGDDEVKNLPLPLRRRGGPAGR